MGKRYRRYRNFLEKFLDSEFGRRFFNIVYSVGAAVVILGAMFKILHLPFGNQMLMIGMITEACVFLLSAFEKPAKEYKWEEVYPVLAENSEFIPKSEREHLQTQSHPAVQHTSTPATSGRASTGTPVNSSQGASTSTTGGSNVNIPAANTSGSGSGGTTVVIGSGSGNNTASSTPSAGTDITTGGSTISGGTIILGGSAGSGTSPEQMAQMADNVEKFTQVTDSLTKISETLLKSFQTIVDNSKGIGNNTQGYIAQMEALNRNVSGLNTIYEIQLKGVSGQINSIEQINAGLDRIKKLYDGSLADSSIFKNETEKMAQQLTELNRVYARLLEAMTSNMNPGAGNINNNSGGNI